MRKYPNTLLEIIEKSGTNLNSISKLSGVSNTYLTKLSKGLINHPGKDKIASILLALNHTISGINEILALYDYQPLNEYDIPAILRNNRRRKIEGRMLPHYDRLYFELMLAVFEHVGGTKILIKNRPSGIYQPYMYYMMKEFQLEVDGEAAKFLYNLTGHVVRERLQKFHENCEKGDKIINYMCSRCLEEEIEKTLNKAAGEKDDLRLRLFAQYCANAVSCAIKFPEQHKLYITERCSMFEFFIQNADSEKPKINFTSNSPHSFSNPYDKHNLEGFTTDSASILNIFKLEVEMCEAAIDHDDLRNTPQGMREYIHSMFDKWKAAHLFDEAMAELMSTPNLKLF